MQIRNGLAIALFWALPLALGSPCLAVPAQAIAGLPLAAAVHDGLLRQVSAERSGRCYDAWGYTSRCYYLKATKHYYRRYPPHGQGWMWNGGTSFYKGPRFYSGPDFYPGWRPW